MDRLVAELRLTPEPASRTRWPAHLWIKPDDNEPRYFSAELHDLQFFVLYFVGDQMLMRLATTLAS